MDEARRDEKAQAGEGPGQRELGEQVCNIKCTIVLQRTAGLKSRFRFVKNRVLRQLDAPSQRLVNR